MRQAAFGIRHSMQYVASGVLTRVVTAIDTRGLSEISLRQSKNSSQRLHRTAAGLINSGTVVNRLNIRVLRQHHCQ